MKTLVIRNFSQLHPPHVTTSKKIVNVTFIYLIVCNNIHVEMTRYAPPPLRRVKLEMVQHLHLMILDRHHSCDETVIEANRLERTKVCKAVLCSYFT